MASPLAQFEINKLIQLNVGDFDVSFTNSSLAMVLSVVFILTILFFGLKNLKIICHSFFVDFYL